MDWQTAVWLCALLGVLVFCVWLMPRIGGPGDKIVGLLSLLLCCWIVTAFLVADPVSEKAAKENIGRPIIQQSYSLEGKVFTPQAIVVLSNRVLIYNNDSRVYALDGIRLEKGFDPAFAPIGTNRYVVYRKLDNLYFGPYN
jgi:hypothetical protein